MKLKGADLQTNLQDLANAPESLKNLGHHLQIAAMGGDVRMMGENVLYNTLKSQFLDPILSPESVTDKGKRYGGKAVIKQSFKFRDLDKTARTGEGKDTKINPGEIMLPHNVREGDISFDGADVLLKGVDKNGKVKDLKEILSDYWKKTNRDVDVSWDYLTKNGNLGMAFDQLQRITKGKW